LSKKTHLLGPDLEAKYGLPPNVRQNQFWINTNT